MASHPFEIVYDGPGSASYQMEQDRCLFASLENLQKPLIRFYDWSSPAITYGYFVKPEQFLKPGYVCFDVAKRPTGGGILFHGHDVAFAVLIPMSSGLCSEVVLENYKRINTASLKAALEVTQGDISLYDAPDRGDFRALCMATPTKYDLIYNGYKIGGSAERKNKYGLLHQGSVFLFPPNWSTIEEVLLDGARSVEAMKKSSASLFTESVSQKRKEQFQKALRHYLRTEL
jgi:lipoate---protein ligase